MPMSWKRRGCSEKCPKNSLSNQPLFSKEMFQWIMMDPNNVKWNSLTCWRLSCHGPPFKNQERRCSTLKGVCRTLRWQQPQGWSGITRRANLKNAVPPEEGTLQRVQDNILHSLSGNYSEPGTEGSAIKINEKKTEVVSNSFPFRILLRPKITEGPRLVLWPPSSTQSQASPKRPRSEPKSRRKRGAVGAVALALGSSPKLLRFLQLSRNVMEIPNLALGTYWTSGIKSTAAVACMSWRNVPDSWSGVEHVEAFKHWKEKLDDTLSNRNYWPNKKMLWSFLRSLKQQLAVVN